MDIGAILREYRKAARLTQADISQRLQVSKNAVCKWETGAAIPGLDAVMQLADVYHVSLDSLCGRTKPEGTKVFTRYDILRDIEELEEVGIIAFGIDKDSYKYGKMEIKDQSPWVIDFYLKRAQLMALVADGTLDQTVLDDWLVQQYERMRNTPAKEAGQDGEKAKR